MKVEQLRVYPDHVEAEILVDESTFERHEFSIPLEGEAELGAAVETLEGEVLRLATVQVEGWLERK